VRSRTATFSITFAVSSVERRAAERRARGLERIVPRRPSRAVAATVTMISGLSGPFHKYGDVGGERFFAQARREHRAYPQGSVRCEQRSLREEEPPNTLPYLGNGPLKAEPSTALWRRGDTAKSASANPGSGPAATTGGDPAVPVVEGGAGVGIHQTRAPAKRGPGGSDRAAGGRDVVHEAHRPSW
jgi:hypothetical protein